MIEKTLDKEDIINMIIGIEPSFDSMSNEDIKLCGEYNGSYGTWTWRKTSLMSMQEIELWEMYKLLKNQYDT